MTNRSPFNFGIHVTSSEIRRGILGISPLKIQLYLSSCSSYLENAAASSGRVFAISPARESSTSLVLRVIVHRFVTADSFFREDIIAVMEDVGVYGLVHHDVTAFNLLRFTGSEKETPQARCPHHNVVHDWRIIDFDRSFRMDMETADKTSKRSIRYNSAYIGNAGSFWGNCF